MRTILFALVFPLVAACGSQPDKPMLANAPRPDPAAVAGVAAAAAAAVTLANPNATQAPEKRDQFENKQPVEVKERVTPDVLDHLDQAGSGSGSDAGAPSAVTAKPAVARPAAKKTKGKPPKIPSPQDAAANVGPANDAPDAIPAR
jgi:hypothetical protein